MPNSFDSHDNPVIRKLDSVFALTEDERQAILSLPMQVTVLKENQDIVREGDSPSRSCLLISGFACTYKVTGDGRRQIMAFNIAGDVPDLQSLHLRVLDNSVGTLTPCRVGFIPHEALHGICARHPRVAAALWRETLIDAAIFREWMASIGQREAYPRIAHLLCELMLRLRAVGLADGHGFDLPITQAEFGDALGLSTVHVNRIFQTLRADGLIETKGTRMNIPDWEKLEKAGDFDSTYLHLRQEQPAA
jgi:CRP-like cAMP-binding protein